MNTIIVSGNAYYSHYPKRIPKGTVKAETVALRLDKSWTGLTVFVHWKNIAAGVEKRILLEDAAQPHEVPWEVLADLGELRMGLVGMDGEEIVKPTIWLTYGYVVEGVDPEAGEDPQPPTPGWEQQMVEQATQANQAAQAAQEAAEDAAESAASAGPYADQAKKSAEAAKASQEAAATSAQQASQAAKDAQAAAGSIGDAVQRAEQAATAAGSAQRAAETAQTAAAQSAGTAQGAATTAGQAAQTAQGAATQAGQYLSTVEADAQAAANAATAAGESQEAAQSAAQEAGNARDQATTAATTAQGHATAADTAKTAAEQAAGNAASAKAEAAQSAQNAAGSASAAQAAKEAAEAAASILPAPTPEDAGKVPMVNPEGDGYIFGEAGGGAMSEHPWRLVSATTAAEEVSSILVSTDSDGDPFELNHLLLLFSCNANITSKTQVFRVYINDTQVYQSGDNIIPTSGSRYFYLELIYLDGRWLAKDSRYSTFETGYPQTNAGGWLSTKHNQELAKSIKVTGFAPFGAGSTLKVYGRE